MATGVIAQGLTIRGEVLGEEDLIVEGVVEGTITMEKSLTIEKSGRIKANIETESIIIMGVMEGDLKARDKISIHAGARVVGDIEAPRVDIADGAYYKGLITMSG